MKIVRLENSFMSIGFDEATGNLVELVDKATGRVLLNSSKYARLFRVVAPSQRWLARYADSHHARRPDIFESPGELTISYRTLEAIDGEMQVAAMVRVILPDDSPEAILTLTLTNHGKDRAHEVRFPWIGGWNGIDGPEHDKALLGCIPVSLCVSDEKEIFQYNLGNSHRRTYYSNVGMILPFVDISGKDCGISYINHGEKPRAGGVVVENLDPEPNGFAMSFSWVHMPFVENDQMWTSPPIGIGVHSGDWHATSERYRTWANKWWRAPATPEALRESIGFQTVQMRTFEGLPNFMFKGLPKMAEDGLQYGVTDLCVWDPIAAIYLRPDDGDFWEEYDPTQSIDDLRYSLALVREMGVNASTLVNYRLIRQRTPQYMSFGEEHVQRTVSGAPITDDWTTCSSSHANFKTAYLGQCGVALCQRSPGFVKRALEITRKTMHLGFTSLFIDQAFDPNPCLSDSHGHSSPDDTPEAALDWIREASPIIRAQSPDSYIIGENCDVFVSQYIDVSWNWAWNSVATEVVRYTFPETLLCYVVDHQPEVLNRAFALGCLAAFTTSMAERTLVDYPEFADQVKLLADLRKKTAEYVARAEFRDNVGLTYEGAYACLYESLNHMSVVVADCEGTEGETKLTVDLAEYGRNEVTSAKLYRSDGSVSEVYMDCTNGTASCAIGMEPFEVCVLVLETPQPTNIVVL